jgi:hypothetical protein
MTKAFDDQNTYAVLLDSDGNETSSRIDVSVKFDLYGADGPTLAFTQETMLEVKGKPATVLKIGRWDDQNVFIKLTVKQLTGDDAVARYVGINPIEVST